MCDGLCVHKLRVLDMRGVRAFVSHDPPPTAHWRYDNYSHENERRPVRPNVRVYYACVSMFNSIPTNTFVHIMFVCVYLPSKCVTLHINDEFESMKTDPCLYYLHRANNRHSTTTSPHLRRISLWHHCPIPALGSN